MAYPKHGLVTFGGTLGTAPAADTWQCGVRLMATDLANPVANPDGWFLNKSSYLSAIQAPLLAWFVNSTRGGGSMRGDSHITWVKVANIAPGTTPKGAPSGHYPTGDPAVIGTYSSGNQGTVGASAPYVVTAAVSWTTALSRGRGHTGRIYLPFAWSTADNGANISATTVNNMLAAAKALLSLLAVSSSGNSTMAPMVVSKFGVAQAITGVRVGNVVDVQRRRKEQIPETYTSSTWP